ncbi:hypothetical protein TIFTF001_013995 [Ficus carica]|uniref:Uncharacterized protein n=1 Tax=Ficus carica TaxID=3494 RepID=A0AA88A2Z8_FICCA|nr:hypothetical protein TIFTF001_013995 [Ficus carica]
MTNSDQTYSYQFQPILREGAQLAQTVLTMRQLTPPAQLDRECWGVIVDGVMFLTLETTFPLGKEVVENQ